MRLSTLNRIQADFDARRRYGMNPDQLVTAHALLRCDWTDIATESGVDKKTLYRWRKGPRKINGRIRGPRFDCYRPSVKVQRKVREALERMGVEFHEATTKSPAWATLKSGRKRPRY